MMSTGNSQAMNKMVTNVLVGHDEKSMSLETNDSCGRCQLRLINVGETNLNHPYNSNQLSETRAFLEINPQSIDTPYVAFSSLKIAIKTNGLLTAHSGCFLAPKMSKTTVLAPYLIHQNLKNLVVPESHAPLTPF